MLEKDVGSTDKVVGYTDALKWQRNDIILRDMIANPKKWGI